MKRLNVEVSNAVHTALKLRAAYDGTTVSALVNKLLRDYLAAEQPHPRRRATDYAA